jgi:hypothetical protein
MKRSEMIEFISETILNEMYDAGLSLEGASRYHKSLEEIILDGIEKSGMLPPKIENPKSKGMSYTTLMHSGTPSKINDWESEDDSDS